MDGLDENTHLSGKSKPASQETSDRRSELKDQNKRSAYKLLHVSKTGTSDKRGPYSLLLKVCCWW